MEDAMAQLGGLGSAMKEPLSVTFSDAHGMQEAGARLQRPGTAGSAPPAVAEPA